MIEIRKAKEVEGDIRLKVTEVFVDAFGRYFTFFTHDSSVLVETFKHMFNLDLFFVALIDGEVAGIAACNDGNNFTITHIKKILRKNLGYLKGSILNFVLKREFQKTVVPLTPGIASIEFVATKSIYRNKGVASSLINFIIKGTNFNEYILEVADTNHSAFMLYEKLGFIVFFKVKQKHSRVTGVNFLVYMKFCKNNL